MSQCLPTGGFKWRMEKELAKIDIGKYTEDSKKEMIFEVDLEYPKKLHFIHNDYSI